MFLFLFLFYLFIYLFIYLFFFLLVDGGWSRWSVFSACSVTCGSGEEVFTRTCSNPVPQHSGKPCQGSTRNVQWCTKKPCPSM